jgi:hypothetical protein
MSTSRPVMATSDVDEPGLLGKSLLVLAALFVGWLEDRAVVGTALLSLVAMLEGFGAGGPVWPFVGLAAAAGAVFAVLGPLLRPWSAQRVWLTMGMVLAFDLSVVFALVPP